MKVNLDIPDDAVVLLAPALRQHFGATLPANASDRAVVQQGAGRYLREVFTDLVGRHAAQQAHNKVLQDTAVALSGISSNTLEPGSTAAG